MPDGTGTELFSVLHRTLPGILSVLATAFSDLDCAIAAVNSRAVYHYVVKLWEQADPRVWGQPGVSISVVPAGRDWRNIQVPNCFSPRSPQGSGPAWPRHHRALTTWGPPTLSPVHTDGRWRYGDSPPWAGASLQLFRSIRKPFPYLGSVHNGLSGLSPGWMHDVTHG